MKFFDWMRADGAMTVRFGERQCPGCGVQSVQLVRSRAQLLGAVVCSKRTSQKNPVIEIPTVKWKEGGLLVARPSRGLPPRDQLSIGN